MSSIKFDSQQSGTLSCPEQYATQSCDNTEDLITNIDRIATLSLNSKEENLVKSTTSGRLEENAKEPELNNEALLKDKIQELEKTVKSLKSEIHDLKNLLIDKEFESGIFIEKDIFNKLDQENTKLRKLLEEYYKNEVNKWYAEVKQRLREIDRESTM